MKILIIGYGNPIRGDDAVGLLVAQHLSNTTLSLKIKIITRHILTIDLIPLISVQERVIFIDASVNTVPGNIQIICLTPQIKINLTFAHALHPSELLAGCLALYKNIPECYLISVGGLSFEYNYYQLTPIVAASFNQIITQVKLLCLNN